MTTVDAVKHKDATFIDIRESYELELDGEIEKAINIPLTQIPDRVDEIKQMQKPIVVFCRGGNRANSAFRYLIDHGVEEIFCAGGYEDVHEILNS